MSCSKQIRSTLWCSTAIALLSIASPPQARQPHPPQVLLLTALHLNKPNSVRYHTQLMSMPSNESILLFLNHPQAPHRAPILWSQARRASLPQTTQRPRRRTRRGADGSEILKLVIKLFAVLVRCFCLCASAGSATSCEHTIAWSPATATAQEDRTMKIRVSVLLTAHRDNQV